MVVRPASPDDVPEIARESTRPPVLRAKRPALRDDLIEPHFGAHPTEVARYVRDLRA